MLSGEMSYDHRCWRFLPEPALKLIKAHLFCCVRCAWCKELFSVSPVVDEILPIFMVTSWDEEGFPLDEEVCSEECKKEMSIYEHEVYICKLEQEQDDDVDNYDYVYGC